MNDHDNSEGGLQGKRNPFTQRQAATLRRTNALFKAMSTDFLLREQFVTNPAQIISEFVHDKKVSASEADITNHMVYSVMSNPGLVDWVRSYVAHHRDQLPTDQKFLTDFGRAVVEHGGDHVVLALIRGAFEKERGIGFQDVLLPLITAIFGPDGGLASGTEMSTGTYATEQSGTHISSSGTEMSTGTYATEQSGTHISASTTEMSTGTYATQQSGTHISSVGLAHRVTLEALVQYANQLRKIGALDVLWGE